MKTNKIEKLMKKIIKLAYIDREKNKKKINEFLNKNPLFKRYKELVDEGLIKSYPPKKVWDWLNPILNKEKSAGNIFRWTIEIENDPVNDIPILELTVYGKTNFPFERKISAPGALSNLGWFIGGKDERWILSDETNEQEYVQGFILEPKYPINNKNIDQKTKGIVSNVKDGIFYHVTFSKYIDKILKNGLIPKSNSKRKHFMYPDRIYLFSNSDDVVKFVENHLVAIDTDELSLNGSINIPLLTANANVIGKTKNSTTPVFAKQEFQPTKVGICVLKVDIRKLLNDKIKENGTFNLYHDSRYGVPNSAFFTYDNIPPKYLELYHEEIIDISGI